MGHTRVTFTCGWSLCKPKTSVKKVMLSMLFRRSSASIVSVCNIGAHLSSVLSTKMQLWLPHPTTTLRDSSLGRLIELIPKGPVPTPACRHCHPPNPNSVTSSITLTYYLDVGTKKFSATKTSHNRDKTGQLNNKS